MTHNNDTNDNNDEKLGWIESFNGYALDDIKVVGDRDIRLRIDIEETRRGKYQVNQKIEYYTQVCGRRDGVDIIESVEFEEIEDAEEKRDSMLDSIDNYDDVQLP